MHLHDGARLAGAQVESAGRSLPGPPAIRNIVAAREPGRRQHLDVEPDRPGHRSAAVERHVDRAALGAVRRLDRAPGDRRARLARSDQQARRSTSPRRKRRPTRHARVAVPCTLPMPGIRYGTGASSVRERQSHWFRPRRLGRFGSPARARRRRGRRRPTRSPLRAGQLDRRGGERARGGPLGRACLRGDAPVGTRPAPAPLLDASAPDVHARARARAARRRLGRGHC